MIRMNTFNTAVGVASQLAAQGKVLVPQPSTPLSELLSASSPDASMISQGMASDYQGVEAYGWLMSMLTEDTAAKPSDHSLLCGDQVDKIAPLVASHIAFARNVVKPLTMELGNILATRAQEMRSANPATGVEIKSVSLPALLKDESFLDTLRYYKDRTPSEPKNYLSLGTKGAEDIVKLMMTGHQRTDEMIAEWLSSMPEFFIPKIWNSFFNVTADHEVVYNAEEINGMHHFERCSFALGVYLIARKIYDDVQESKMSLDRYKNITMDIRDYAGDMLTMTLAFVYRAIEGQVLVLHSNQYEKSITVNGEIYSGWIEKGGKPEILLGMLISNSVATTIPMIDENAEKHARAWQGYVSWQNTDIANKFYDKYRQAIVVEYEKQLLLQDESECPINERSTERLAQLAAKAAEYVETLKDSELADTHAVALVLVAKFRFGHTSSYQILFDIAEAFKANPEVDVREAALLAAINYLGDWYAGMISCTTD